MTEEEQRIAIAEECGWVRYDGFYSPSWWPPDAPRRSYEFLEGNLPEYLQDLNAMNEAETHLNGYEWSDYFDWIQKHGIATGVRATAAQRAEAFLKCKNLWKP